MPSELDAGGWLRPAWRVNPRVHALMSTRRTRPSADGQDFDPGRDALTPAALHNRAQLAKALGAAPRWLHQVHGSQVVRVDRGVEAEELVADASVSASAGIGCVVLVADCLPVLFCDDAGRAVAAAHAGWRGLAAGVLEHSVASLCEAAGCEPVAVQAWLGPCIGPRRFEVGADVLEAFDVDPEAGAAQQAQAFFLRRDRADGDRRWLADLPALARQRLARCGVQRVSGGQWCTFEDATSFFSFRRDGARGRMAAAIALID